MNVRQAKSLPLVDFVKKLPSARFSHKSGTNEHYFYSPFRQENTPSFAVNSVKNCWKDYGNDLGGSIIDLVIHLEGCKVSDALRRIQGIWGEESIPLFSFKDQKKLIGPDLVVQEVREPHFPSLIRYAASRGIPREIVCAWTQQIHFIRRSQKTKRPQWALGIKNVKGGYVLRNKNFNGAISPNAPSFLGAEHPNCDTVYIFEGMFDFLSMLTLKKTIKLPADVIILNSVSFVKEAMELIEVRPVPYTTIKTFMDNDPAGEKATDFFLNNGYCDVLTANGFYDGYRDLNEGLVALRNGSKNRMVPEFCNMLG